MRNQLKEKKRSNSPQKTSFFVFKQFFLFLITCLSVLLVNAQTSTIKGKVSIGDSASASVTVQVKGTPLTTQTDANGEYTIAAAPTATLVFSSIGFATQEIVVGTKTTIDVVLIASSQQLDQVVVIGYGTQRRKDVTGSVSSVTAAQIEKVPVTTIDQALQGRSPGVQVTNNDASPGSGIQVQIRGIGSFGDNSPLYVVDGYPITGGLNNINPSDIASMDILKDASATAIYGNRAANGVVIITTKRGRKDGIQISVDALTSVQAKPKTYKVLNAQQFVALANERSGPDGYVLPTEWSNPGALRNIDWQDEVYQNGLRQNYNVALRGGNEKVQSNFSLGYLDQTGIVMESFYKRINAGLGVDYTPNKWLKSSTNIKYSRVDNKVSFGTGGQNAGFGIGTLTRLIPTLNGNPLTDMVKDGNGNYGFNVKTNQLINGLDNVVAQIETQDQKNLNNYFLGNTFIEATILPGLRLKTNIGINTSDYSGYYFTPSHNRSASTVLSFYTQSANNTFDWLWENTIAYTKSFGLHNIDFVGGVSAQKTTFRSVGGSGNGSVSDELRDLGTGVSTVNSVFGNQQVTSLSSEFGRLNYRFSDKYILTATVRHDGSSRFADGNQYGTFPSVSAAWRIKNEQFLKNNNAIYDLKLRAGYGEVGNQSIAPFQYLGQYRSGGGAAATANTGYPFNKIFQEGIVLNVLPNPDLKWETSKQTNIGLDASFLNGNLNLTVDYFVKESRDFLLSIPIPAQTGFTTAARNVGSIRNKGLEIALEYRESKKEFKYGIAVNLTTVDNKLLSLAPGQSAISNLLNFDIPASGSVPWNVFTQSRVGESVGSFFGYNTDGIFQTQAEIDAINAAALARYGGNTTYQGSAVQPGDRKFADINGLDSTGKLTGRPDGRITDDDRTVLGSPLPKYYAGLNVDASYKNFDFNMFWYASVGNDILNYAERTLQNFQVGIGIGNVSENYFLNRWTPTNPSNIYPRATFKDVNGNGRPSDAFVEDGSYVRLRNVQLGYTLPSSFFKAANFTKFRLYLSAQNLFTITNYSGLDPEIGNAADPATGGRSVTASGVDVGTYPNSKSFTFGLNITF